VSSREISGEVPPSAKAGDYIVTVTVPNTAPATHSAKLTIKTPQQPAVSDFAPHSAAWDTFVTVRGGPFTRRTKIEIGGKNASVLLVSTTEIQGVVPPTLAPGDYDIKVTVPDAPNAV